MNTSKELENSIFNEILNETANIFLVSQRVEKALIFLAEEPKSDCKLVLLNGENSRSLANFMEEASVKLKFPSHFGKNWSAFSDSFQDRLVKDEDSYKSYFLVITNADELLVDAKVEDTEALLEVLQDSIDALADPESVMEIKIIFCVNDLQSSSTQKIILNKKIIHKVIQ